MECHENQSSGFDVTTGSFHGFLAYSGGIALKILSAFRVSQSVRFSHCLTSARVSKNMETELTSGQVQVLVWHPWSNGNPPISNE